MGSDIDNRERPRIHFLFIVGIIASGIAIVILDLLDPSGADLSLSIHIAIDDIAIHGFFDATNHLLTAFMVAIALRSLKLPIPVWSVLIGGLILDVGHVMTILDVTDPITGSSRNGTHSGVVVMLIALIGILDRRHANIWIGIALGGLSHLWRDMGTGKVPMAWPIVSDVWGISYAVYVIGLLSVTVVALLGGGAFLNVDFDAPKDTPSDSTSTHSKQFDASTR